MKPKLRILYLLLAFALAAVLLSGCLQVDIGIGIDEVNNSYLSYGITMDVSEVDAQYHEILQNALNNLGWLYQENYGFAARFDADSYIYTLSMQKMVQNDSFPEALETLEAMLTDESITAFSTVDMAMESFPRQDSYTIGATLDISRIIALSNAVELPPDLLAALKEALETSNGTITLTVPNSELVASSHEVENQYRIATMKVPFGLSRLSGFEFQGSVIYSDDGAKAGTSEEIIDELMWLRTVVMIASGAALALLLIILLAVLLRKRRYDW